MLIIDEYGVCVLEEWLKRDGLMVVWQYGQWDEVTENEKRVWMNKEMSVCYKSKEYWYDGWSECVDCIDELK